MSISIRSFHREDWTAVADIYRHGLETGNASFETEVPPFDVWIKKFHEHLLFVAETHGKVVGWAGLQPVSVRKVYEGVVEVTIYIDPSHVGKGIGKMLMAHLIGESERSGIWTLYASIFPENTASIQLHRSAGFRQIGYREKIGQLNGKWRNTVLFERRSTRTGI
jgi:L-amino acid N-acyltransferase YncA